MFVLEVKVYLKNLCYLKIEDANSKYLSVKAVRIKS